MSTPVTHVPTGAQKRRSQRVFVQVTVIAHGQTPEHQSFHEKTHTIAVNAHGGLILMEAAVRIGHKLTLTHAATERDQECRVVFLGPKQSGKVQVGLEFTNPSANFWHIAFPPEDWKAVPE